MDSRKDIRRALISVYDKNRLEEIGKALSGAGVEIIATGSTAKTLAGCGITIKEVSEVTGFPEIMDGRVKTLHPSIHSGILADQNNSNHTSALTELGIEPFDLVIINLYPFEETIAAGSSFAECIEQIDIGGPSMLRGAAKNHGSVTVISKTEQYDQLLAGISAGGFTKEERQKFALEVFRSTAEFDLAIANWLGQNSQAELPEWFGRIYTKENSLRYGENPHQSASIYSDGSEGIVQAKQLHGKEMSFNNYTDADAAWRAAYDHADPCVAIIKHANPCGIAVNKDIAIAYAKAFECDSVSAYGAVVAANREVTTQMALALSETFTEVLIAPGFESGALEVLTQKPSIRILECVATKRQRIELRPISGGALLQEVDAIDSTGDSSATWKLVAGSQANSVTMKDLEFAWRAVRSVKSNAILLAKDGATIGVGMGQVNRVDSAELAVKRAGVRATASVASSDAFFPFADGLKVLINAGITAVVSPGGSVRDEEVIAAAEQAGITLYFTGTRHFSHS
jgi:phosphoribosylaminoimidazolecarboxamide formyltransferase / IMP cyclohydrolase